MKRTELEQKLKEMGKTMRARIESSPVPAAAYAFSAGVLLTLLRSALLPVLVLVIIGIAAAWFFAEGDEPGAQKKGQ